MQHMQWRRQGEAAPSGKGQQLEADHDDRYPNRLHSDACGAPPQIPQFLPCEVRHQQDRVQNESNRVVHRLVVRERAVAALVRQHPQATAGEGLQNGVRYPEGNRDSGGKVGRQLRGKQFGDERGVVDVGHSDVEERGDDDEVDEKVVQGAEEGAAEAVRGDRALKVGESEGGLSLREEE